MEKAVLSFLLVGLLAVFSTSSAQDVHSVVGAQPLYLADGSTGEFFRDLKGCCSMNWKDLTRYGFFNAKIVVLDIPAKPTYEFQLVSIGNCSKTTIEGLWDIKKNGALVASGIVGKLYGIDQTVGHYFKFYGGDDLCYAEKWHVSAYITNRVDY